MLDALAFQAQSRLWEVLLLQNGQVPQLKDLVGDSDSEPEPDAVVHVPINKVKLVVGPGGEKIKQIQRKSKCQLQARQKHIAASACPV